jgi:hypothetical protein
MHPFLGTAAGVALVVVFAIVLLRGTRKHTDD